MPPRRFVPAVLLALLCCAVPALADGGTDTTPPVAPDLVVDTPVFSFSGEPGGSFECQIDLGGWMACDSPWDSGVTAVGDHTVDVHQIDDAGNVGDAASFSWTLAPSDDGSDSLDPSLPLDSSQPLDQPAPAPDGGPTARPSVAPVPRPVTPRLSVRVAKHSGYVAVRCGLRSAAIGRCDVKLGPLGRGATLGREDAHAVVVYVKLTDAALRRLQSHPHLPVVARVVARPYGGGPALATVRRIVL